MSRNKAIWLAKLLFRRGRLSRREILDAWAACDEKAQPMASSTFYDNLHLLWERYGIVVRADGGLYGLELREGREREFLRRLFCEEGDGNGSTAIIDEPRPAGYDCIAAISRSMDSRMCMEAEYAPFDKPRYTTVIAPYCLRVFRGRCYVVGLSSAHGEVRTFALDRVTRLEHTAKPFPRAPKFDAREYFANSFGVYGGTCQKPEHIVLDADALNASFLRTLPLHSSQRETPLKDNGGKYAFRFEMDICITADLLHELMYYGAGIRIVQPLELMEAILRENRAVAAAYSGKDLMP